MGTVYFAQVDIFDNSVWGRVAHFELQKDYTFGSLIANQQGMWPDDVILIQDPYWESKQIQIDDLDNKRVIDEKDFSRLDLAECSVQARLLLLCVQSLDNEKTRVLLWST